MIRSWGAPARAQSAPPAAVARSGAPALQLAGIAHRFGRRWVLRGASLEVRAGEVVLLVGRNGAGKTTLLRIVATLLSPTRGTGRVFGHDLIHEAAAVREVIGMLGHGAALYEDLTAAENLRFAYRMRGLPADAAEVERLLDGVGLLREANARVRGFSSGMRRRLALARLLIAPPRLLLMDEPYASLDADGVRRVNALVRSTKAKGGAVVMASHELRSVGEVADRVLLLERGVVHERDLEATMNGEWEHEVAADVEERAVQP